MLLIGTMSIDMITIIGAFLKNCFALYFTILKPNQVEKLETQFRDEIRV